MARRGYDEGSIWKRSDGRWSGSYFVPTATGARVRRYVYGATRDEVHAKLESIIGQRCASAGLATTFQRRHSGQRTRAGSGVQRWRVPSA